MVELDVHLIAEREPARAAGGPADDFALSIAWFGESDKPRREAVLASRVAGRVDRGGAARRGRDDHADGVRRGRRCPPVAWPGAARRPAGDGSRRICGGHRGQWRRSAHARARVRRRDRRPPRGDRRGPGAGPSRPGRRRPRPGPGACRRRLTRTTRHEQRARSPSSAGRGSPTPSANTRSRPSTAGRHERPSYGLDAAAALGVDPRRIFKTLVAAVDGELAVAIVPVAGELDLKAFADALRRPSRGAGRPGRGRAGDRLRGRRDQPDPASAAACRPCSTRPRPRSRRSSSGAGRRGLQVEIAPGDLDHGHGGDDRAHRPGRLNAPNDRRPGTGPIGRATGFHASGILPDPRPRRQDKQKTAAPTAEPCRPAERPHARPPSGSAHPVPRPDPSRPARWRACARAPRVAPRARLCRRRHHHRHRDSCAVFRERGGKSVAGPPRGAQRASRPSNPAAARQPGDRRRLRHHRRSRPSRGRRDAQHEGRHRRRARRQSATSQLHLRAPGSSPRRPARTARR